MGMPYSSNHSSDTVHGFLTANPWDVTLCTTTINENKSSLRRGGGEKTEMDGGSSDQNRDVFGTDVIFSITASPTYPHLTPQPLILMHVTG